MSASIPAFSLITTCKGRRAQLAACLPTWLRQHGVVFEIIVVDFDCPDGTAAWLAQSENHLPNPFGREIRLVRVQNRPLFNLNEARNLGLKAAKGTWILMIDSDVSLLNDNFLIELEALMRAGLTFAGTIPVLHSAHKQAVLFYDWQYRVKLSAPMLLPFYGANLGLSGTACFEREQALLLGGYDEALSRQGYGCDDIAFYLRLLNEPLGERLKAASPDSWLKLLERALSAVGQLPKGLQTEDQDESEKGRFYDKNIHESSERTASALSDWVRGWCSRWQKQSSWLALGAFDYQGSGESVPAEFRSWWAYWLAVNMAERGLLESQRAVLTDLARQLPELQTLWHPSSVTEPMLHFSNYQLYQHAVLLFHANLLPQSELLFEAYLRRLNLVPSAQANVCFYLGELALLSHNPGRAADYFTQSLQFNPHHRKAAERLSQCRLSTSRSLSNEPRLD